MKTDAVSQLRDALKDSGWPVSDVSVFACLLSVPPLVPWSLVRSVRRTFWPGGTLGLEFDLVRSDLVDARGSRGLVFRSDFVSDARRMLREVVVTEPGQSTKELLIGPVDDLGPLLPPLVALEVEVVWAFISEPEFMDPCNALLRDALLTMVREGRRGIKDWMVGAVARLPAEVFTTPAGWLMGRVAGVNHAAVAPSVDPELLAEVAVMLPAGLIAFSRMDGMTEFGPPSRKRRHAVRVVQVPGSGLDVTWSKDGSTDASAFVEPGGAAVTLPTGTGEVILTDILGDQYRLPGFSGDVSPEVSELDASLDWLEARWRNAEIFVAKVTRLIDGTGILVETPEASALQVLVPSSRWRSEYPPPAEYVCHIRIVDLDRRGQFVVAGEVAFQESWLGAGLKVGDRCFARVAKMFKFGFGLKRDDGLFGLLHDSEVPIDVDFEVGQKVEVEIIEIDNDRQRITFSLVPRRPPAVRPRNGAFRDESDEDAYRVSVIGSLPPVGAELDGIVVRILPFGVFAQIGPNGGTDGLLHRTMIPADTHIEVGDRLRLTLIGIDGNRVTLGWAPLILEDQGWRPPPPPKRAAKRPQ